MRLLIIHISDLHLHEDHNSCESKLCQIGTALQNEEIAVDAVAVIVSGDIAYSGKPSEYDVAQRCMAKLNDDLCTRLRTTNVRFVYVPGNHDCDFSVDDSVREMVIDGIRSGKQIDDSIIRCCCNVQTNFCLFRDSSPATKPHIEYDALRWAYRLSSGEQSVLINCINTAWMSRKREQQGEIHLPDSVMNCAEKHEVADYVVTVFHHPYNWMPSATYKKFREFVEEISDVILTGHEHEPDHYHKYTQSGEVNDYLEGAVFQESGCTSRSGFHAVYVDLDIQKQRTTLYSWEKVRFLPVAGMVNDWVSYKRGSRGGRREFELTDDYIAKLDDPGANYQHPAKASLTLSDIYVFPNLKQFEMKKGGEYVYNSLVEGPEVLKTIASKSHVIIFGRQQSGKSTLAKVLFKDFYNKNLTPVLISGDDITATHLKDKQLEGHIEREFQKIYKNPDLAIYQQLDRDKTVIMIDDLDHSRLNASGRIRLLELLVMRFDRVVLFGDDVLKMEEVALGSDGRDVPKEFDQFELLKFGNLLRSRLIGRWHSIGAAHEVEDDEIAKRIIRSEQVITVLLGKNFLPSYPIFILSLLQAQESTISPSSSAGTYGGLYEILITQSLLRNSKVSKLEMKMAYLSEIAYAMFVKKHKRISSEEWDLLHQQYCDKYKIKPPLESLKRDFAANGIFELRDELYGFRYSASYFYFVARYFRDKLTSPEIRRLVVGLLDKLNKEEHSSIWLFLTHLSKDPFLVDSILGHAKKIFADIDLATFSDDVKYLGEMAASVEKIMLNNDSFNDVKENRLRKLDLLPEHDDLDEEYSEEETNEALKLGNKLNLALRTLEVMGQLVKNFPGSLEGTHKHSLVRECYCLGLRVVRLLLDTYKQDTDKFIDMVVDRIVDKHPKVKDKDDLKRRVQEFMFWLIEMCCFAMLKRISNAVGHVDLGETYRELREGFNLNAIDLVDLSVKLDNFGCPENDVIDLHKRLRGNFFCERMLQQLVVEHFYMFPTREKTKQKLCTELKIEISSVHCIDARSGNVRQVSSTALFKPNN